jgi:hypothetical protein
MSTKNKLIIRSSTIKITKNRSTKLALSIPPQKAFPHSPEKKRATQNKRKNRENIQINIFLFLIALTGHSVDEKKNLELNSIL